MNTNSFLCIQLPNTLKDNYLIIMMIILIISNISPIKNLLFFFIVSPSYINALFKWSKPTNIIFSFILFKLESI